MDLIDYLESRVNVMTKVMKVMHVPRPGYEITMYFKDFGGFRPTMESLCRVDIFEQACCTTAYTQQVTIERGDKTYQFELFPGASQSIAIEILEDMCIIRKGDDYKIQNK